MVVVELHRVVSVMDVVTLHQVDFVMGIIILYHVDVINVVTLKTGLCDGCDIKRLGYVVDVVTVMWDIVGVMGVVTLH